jgi:hypothetical protein
MDTAKVRLSKEEMELIIRSDWILTKNQLLQKVNLLLSGVQIHLQPLLSTHVLLPEEIITSSPKISKGENYLGLPWLILDYPRFFNKEDVFAVRNLFWWGNFFSTTFHLAGRYKTAYETKINDSFELFKENDFYFCINEDQWEHHFETGNYAPMSVFTHSSFKEMISKKTFVKLAKKIPLEEWNNVEKKMVAISSQIINALKD